MTKNPRDHREWTNKELEQDSAGYLAAKEAYREDKAKAEQKRRDEDDRKRFTETFVASGGNKGDAEAAWKAHRNEQASEAAKRVDREAELRTRRAMMARL